MNKTEEILSELPDTKTALVILSGGMDSTIAMRLAIEKYGSENVYAISFFYKQKQNIELKKAAESTKILNVKHKLIDISFLGDISQGFSANVDSSIEMPTIKDILGDPQPRTYVPWRNLILFSIAASFAEVNKIETIICGLQVHDEYAYFDVTPTFVKSVNDVFKLNRKHNIKLVAPFISMSKLEELKILYNLDSNVDLLQHTITCYNPNEKGESCGKCPSCSERIGNFMKMKIVDPIPYSVNIPWIIDD